MQSTAKVFTTGSSQAIRLPKAFRVDASEVWISKNEFTGEITLKPKDDDQRQRNIAQMLSLIKENTCIDDFVPDRKVGELRNPFDEATPRAKKGKA